MPHRRFPSHEPLRGAIARTLFAPALVLLLLAPVRAADVRLDLQEEAAFRAAAAAVAPSVVRIEPLGGVERVGSVRMSSGPVSGLIVDAEGHIVSSAFHFARKPSSILVRLPDGSRKNATIVATDHSRNLTLLKIDIEQPLATATPAPIEETRVGQWAVALGRVFSVDSVNMSVGIVSAVDRVWGRSLQTDAAVSPANYGGPLVDIRGRVMGVVTPLSPDSREPTAGFEWYDSGIGFAVPIDDVLAAVDRMKGGDDLHAGLLGARISQQSRLIDKAEIVAVMPKSPAWDAGVKKGDVLVEVNGAAVDRGADALTELGRLYAGDDVSFVVLRDEQRIPMTATLAARIDPFTHGFLGVLPERMNEDFVAGVVVRYVYPDSPADKAGIVVGDRITSCDDIDTPDAETLRSQVGNAGANGELPFKWTTKDGVEKAAPIVLDRLPYEAPTASNGPAPPKHDANGNGDADTLVDWRFAEFDNEVKAYVPPSVADGASAGLVLWAHAAGRYDADAMLDLWRDVCDKYDLILVLPKCEGERWAPTDVDLFARLVEHAKANHAIDPNRVVAFGHGDGGVFASVLGARRGELLTAVAAVDPPGLAPPEANVPDQRLAYYFALSGDQATRQAEVAAEKLRELGFPVTLVEATLAGRWIASDGLRTLARWIDTLDRI